jgi:hypothetical protein
MNCNNLNEYVSTINFFCGNNITEVIYECEKLCLISIVDVLNSCLEDLVSINFDKALENIIDFCYNKNYIINN